MSQRPAENRFPRVTFSRESTGPVQKAYEAFNADGSLKDAKKQGAVEKLGATLAETTAKLKT